MTTRVPLGHLIIGPPSDLTSWVFELVRYLASLQPHRKVRMVDKTDSIGELALSRPIYLCHYPSLEIIDAIERHHLSVVRIAVEPESCIEFLCRTTPCSLMEAVRLGTCSAVANLAIGQAGQSKVVVQPGQNTVDDTIKQLAGALGLRLSDDDVGAAAAALGAPMGRPLPFISAADDHTEPGRNDRAALQLLASCVLAPAMEMAAGRLDRPIVWPVEVFFFGDRPDEQAPRIVDVSGPSRTLYYGPYFYLPPARYRVEAVLAFSQSIQDIPFSLEFHGSYCLARVLIEPRAGGGYRGIFHLNHRISTETVEIRLRNDRGAIEGHVSLEELRFFVDQTT